MALPPLLREGRNCWKISTASKLRFLVDAAAYFDAFAQAAEGARFQIALTAWDVDGRIRLRPDQSGEDLRGFFLRLLTQNPRLNIYILNWKYFISYAKDRELLPGFDAAWRQHPRLHFVWDDSHPLGACHHQKIAVIDNTLAFVGGLDFTHERWDTPRHVPQDPRRRDPNGAAYKPFHDTAIMVEGPVAADLGRLVRRRWRRCARARHRPVPSSHTPGARASYWPLSIAPDISEVRVGISRTEPRYLKAREIREIEKLHIDMIRRARRFVYIESQYFTAERVAAVIGESLEAVNGPEFVILLPRESTGVLEDMSLGRQRVKLIKRLRARDRNGRLHTYFPEVHGAGPDQTIKLHSKLMIVDDLLLRLGSANFCNRSMGVDTECDLALEGNPGSPIHEAIRDFRERLLGEHLDVSPASVRRCVEQRGSLAAAIGELNRKKRGLVPFNGEISPLAEALTVELKVLDPPRPLW